MTGREIAVRVAFLLAVLFLMWMVAHAEAKPTATPVPRPTATRRAPGLGRVPMKMYMNPDPSKKDKPWR